MNLLHLQNKLVAVLGYGLEGRATTKYLLKHGVKPVLFDVKPWQEWPADDQAYIKSLGINFIFGPGYLKELKGFDVVFRSPGIKISGVAQALGLPVKQAAGLHYSEGRTIITSQTKWFFENCPAKIIGVTGTKGKGTTTSLIYEILSVSLREGVHPTTKQSFTDDKIASEPAKALAPRNDTGRIFLTGNIGKTQAFEILDDLKPGDYVVYELSSFQLQDLTISPHIGVVLMTTSEHLDYHKDQAEYIEAKSAITKFQNAEDFAVINADFENSMAIGNLGNGKKIYFSKKRMDVDCYIKYKSVVFVGEDLILPSNDGRIRSAPTENLIIADIKSLQLPGAHNLENICAAICVAKILGVDDGIIGKTVASFKGLEHRLEFVAEKNGVKYYNDSFSTIPETAIAAIDSFTEPEILILGGSSKGSDFGQLINKIETSPNIKSLICIGPEGEKISTELNRRGRYRGKILTGAKNMTEIINQAQAEANTGDVILLSPACASFDMFRNYKERGEEFKIAVLKL